MREGAFIDTFLHTTDRKMERTLRTISIGKQIAFLAKEAPTEAEEKAEKDKDDAKVADRERDLARVWADRCAAA